MLQMASSGYVSARLEHEDPLFEKRRLDMPALPAAITHVVAGSNVLVLALANNTLVRLRLVEMGVHDREEIDLGRKPEDRITGLFMEPAANHLLVW